MPVSPDTTFKPWIVFVGASLAKRPQKFEDFVRNAWSTGIVVGPRHVLTAAHVPLAIEDRVRGKAPVFCLAGVANRRFVGVGALRRVKKFMISRYSPFAPLAATNDYDRVNEGLRTIRGRNALNSDLAMYVAGDDFPANLPRAMVVAQNDTFFTAGTKLNAHGYPHQNKGQLMHTVTATELLGDFGIIMKDGLLGEGASGGPLWIPGNPKPVVVGVISRGMTVNAKGANVVAWTIVQMTTGDPNDRGEYYADAASGDPLRDKDGKLIPVVPGQPPPGPSQNSPPELKEVGAVTRVQPRNQAEITQWIATT